MSMLLYTENSDWSLTAKVKRECDSLVEHNTKLTKKLDNERIIKKKITNNRGRSNKREEEN